MGLVGAHMMLHFIRPPLVDGGETRLEAGRPGGCRSSFRKDADGLD